jgi:hypothetical protein
MAAMDALGQIGNALRNDGWADMAAVVTAVSDELRQQRPDLLSDLRADWNEPFLSLTLIHTDGSTLESRTGRVYGDRRRRCRLPWLVAS